MRLALNRKLHAFQRAVETTDLVSRLKSSLKEIVMGREKEGPIEKAKKKTWPILHQRNLCRRTFCSCSFSILRPAILRSCDLAASPDSSAPAIANSGIVSKCTEDGRVSFGKWLLSLGFARFTAKPSFCCKSNCTRVKAKKEDLLCLP